MRKLFQNKNFTQKIIIALVIVILFNFIYPMKVQAAGFNVLLQGCSWLLVRLTDCAQWIMSFCLTGDATAVMDHAIWDGDSENKDNWEFEKFRYNGLFKYSIEWPKRHLLTPADIFTGKILITNVNFFSDYNDVKDAIASNGWTLGAGEGAILDFSSDSTAENMNKLRVAISKWYMTIRNITVVGLLSVLVYIAIEMVISSASQDKAKYKKMLTDWLVSICLVFLLHYIMAVSIGICEEFTVLMNKEIKDEYYLDPGDKFIYTNPEGRSITYGDENSGEKPIEGLAEKIRVYTQSSESSAAMSYAIMYFAITGYTVMFLWIYMKRFVFMAFFTLIAPIVALTYSIDKVKDGASQAFDGWLKEYIYNSLVQPFNLLIYTVFIGLAYDLASSNFIYVAVVLGTIRIADEQLGKWMGMDKAGTRKSLSEAGKSLLAFKGLQSVLPNTDSAASSSSTSSSGGSSSSTKPTIRTKDNSFLNGGGSSNLPSGSVPENTGTTAQGETGGNGSGQIRQHQTPQQEQTPAPAAAATASANTTNSTARGDINRNYKDSKYVQQGKKWNEINRDKLKQARYQAGYRAKEKTKSALKAAPKTIISTSGKLAGAGLGALMAGVLGQSALDGAIGGVAIGGAFGNTIATKGENAVKGMYEGYQNVFETDERKQMKKLKGNYELQQFYGDKEKQNIAASLAADMKLDIKDDKKTLQSIMDVADEIVNRYDGMDYDDALELSRDMWIDRNNTPTEERSSYTESLRTRFHGEKGKLAADVFEAHGKYGENRLGQVYEARQVNRNNSGV